MAAGDLDLEVALADARQAALLAWEVIAPFYRGRFDIIQKPGEGPATEADLKADHVILAFLAQRYPAESFGLLSEETEQGTERLQRRYCWIVDPIDGTNDFIEGLQDFAVQVGLAGRLRDEDAEHTALVGVVYMPAKGLLFSARRGGGAWLEDLRAGTRTRLRVSPQQAVQGLHLVITRSQFGERMQAVLDSLTPGSVARMGSLGVKVCEVARGARDAYVNTSRRGCKEWDACAPHAILAEAGGRLTDLLGHEITYNRADFHIDQGILASPAHLHPALVDRIRSVGRLWTP